jgi:hypothetical protein
MSPSQGEWVEEGGDRMMPEAHPCSMEMFKGKGPPAPLEGEAEAAPKDARVQS